MFVSSGNFVTFYPHTILHIINITYHTRVLLLLILRGLKLLQNDFEKKSKTELYKTQTLIKCVSTLEILEKIR